MIAHDQYNWGWAAALVLAGTLAGCASLPPAYEEPALTGEYISARQADKKPVLISDVKPVYPARLQRMGIRGEVMLFFVVETDGTVKEAMVVERAYESDDQREFEAAALSALRQWKFSPGEKDGTPVRVTLRISIGFGPG